jgi:hypothetical protein
VTVLLSHQGIALGTLHVALGLNFLWLLHLWLLQPLPQTPSGSEFEVFQGKIATNKLVGIQSIDITTNTRFIEQIFKMNDYNSSYHFIDLNPNTWVQDFNLKWGGYSVDGDGYVYGGVIAANSELFEPPSKCLLSTLNRFLGEVRLIWGDMRLCSALSPLIKEFFALMTGHDGARKWSYRWFFLLELSPVMCQLWKWFICWVDSEYALISPLHLIPQQYTKSRDVHRSNTYTSFRPIKEYDQRGVKTHSKAFRQVFKQRPKNTKYVWPPIIMIVYVFF